MPHRVFPERIGGRLCLDFVNTVDPRMGDDRRDFLPDFDAWLDWCEFAEVGLPRTFSWLRRNARANAASAEGAHREAVSMREALFEVIKASRGGTRVRLADLSGLNKALGDGVGHHILRPDARGGVREEWRPSDALCQLLWPVAIDAWDLLTEPELALVRQCPVDAGGCGRLFLDTSRAGNRRWCDMRRCGNRVKVRAHYSRTARV